MTQGHYINSLWGFVKTFFHFSFSPFPFVFILKLKTHLKRTSRVIQSSYFSFSTLHLWGHCSQIEMMTSWWRKMKVNTFTKVFRIYPVAGVANSPSGISALANWVMQECQGLQLQTHHFSTHRVTVKKGHTYIFLFYPNQRTVPRPMGNLRSWQMMPKWKWHKLQFHQWPFED